jgi:large subunit ribosomal protein L24
MRVKKGDKVYILTGKDRGKSGVVSKIFKEKGKVIVDGVNVVKKTVKGSQKNPQGGIIEKSAPLNTSNVQVICSSCNKSVKTAMKKLKNGKKERVCRKCGKEIKE